MRTYYEIDLASRSATARELHGKEIVLAGRYLIAKTLVERGLAGVDPLAPENPLIFSAGPFAGTTFSNANRTSVGCKSPLTGGIKEANGGGTFSYGLGQLRIAGFTLHGAAPDWVVIHFRKDGGIDFDDATPYLGKGNFEVADLLYTRYSRKVAIALCGPVGEYQGLLAGIAFSDKDLRPSRLAARGGVGAVMGSKRVKAIVVDLDKTPPFGDTKKVNSSIKEYTKLLREDSIVMNFYNKVGTMGMADYQNYIGGLPVRNFSAGQLATTRLRARPSKWAATTSASSTPVAAASRRTRACPAAPSSAAMSITAPMARRLSHRSSTRRSACSAPTAASATPTTWRRSTTSPTTWASTPSKRAPRWAC
jgi:aldehyde:ferredoxin oxidoreductase